MRKSVPDLLSQWWSYTIGGWSSPIGRRSFNMNWHEQSSFTSTRGFYSEAQSDQNLAHRPYGPAIY